jgi:hypothetical protein
MTNGLIGLHTSHVAKVCAELSFKQSRMHFLVSWRSSLTDVRCGAWRSEAELEFT